MSLIALDISKLDISLCFLYLDLSSLWYFNVQPEKNPTYKEKKKILLALLLYEQPRNCLLICHPENQCKNHF